MRKLSSVFLTLAFIVFSSNAYAACRCACVSNERQWICQNSWDVKPGGYCGGWCSGNNEEILIPSPNLSEVTPMDKIRRSSDKVAEITLFKG